MRDLWVRMFDGFARVCYEACDVITTLYRDNQELQLALGADARKLRVIANGIDVRRFDSLDCAGTDARPTIALIGRVVPIKDVKTFIAAAGIVRRRVPELRALVMGPTDEDPAYFQECNQLVRDLGLGDCVEFTGSVKITDWMAQIHVVVLTSLSEAQPLVLIEAGAAGIACVATNVGACREIIEGSAADEAAPERGGFVTDLVAPEETAQRICELLSNPALRVRCGAVLRSRVRQFYASEISRGRYAALYETVLSGRAIAVAGGGA
jgi:glycosyltransferase involved in cell wall biosynthesis